MSTKQFRTVDDCIRFAMDVGVECRGCGRMAVFDAFHLAQVMQERRAGRSLGSWGAIMRCRCGTRRATLRPIERTRRPDPLPQRHTPAVPLYTQPAPANWRPRR